MLCVSTCEDLPHAVQENFEKLHSTFSLGLETELPRSGLFSARFYSGAVFVFLLSGVFGVPSLWRLSPVSIPARCEGQGRKEEMTAGSQLVLDTVLSI